MPPTSTPLPTNTPIPPTDTPEPPTVTVCAIGCDFTTIQAAIDAASTTDDDIIGIMDTVHIEAGIIVTKSVTIQGQGADTTTVQGHNTGREAVDRVFLVPEGVTVSIKHLAIQRGHPSEWPLTGGGIWNKGTLNLESSAVSKNTAANGGGILNRGTMTVINSSISHNVSDGIAPPGYDCGSGGGIHNAAGGRLTLINSTISRNTAEGKGGGMHVACESIATLINSTVIDNRAVRNGGGIHLKGEMRLIDSLISRNRTGANGSGVYVRGTMDYTNTVIIKNYGSDDCIIGGEGGYKGMGKIGIQNNTTVEANDCRPM